MVEITLELFRESGHVPSYRPIAAIIKLANGGRGVSNQRIRETLNKYVAAQARRDFLSRAAHGGRTEPGLVSVALDDRVRADLNGLSLSSSVPSQPKGYDSTLQRETELALPGMDSVKKTRRVTAKREPSDLDRRSWALRDAIVELVAPHLVHMTASQWKSRWSRTAREMAEAGTTPSQAVDAWHQAMQRSGHPLINLSALRDRMVFDAAKSATISTEFVAPADGWDDDLPDVRDRNGV